MHADNNIIATIIVTSIFTGIVAMATINFSLAQVRLLIEGGSYSRMSFINFRRYLAVPSTTTVASTQDWFLMTVLQVTGFHPEGGGGDRGEASPPNFQTSPPPRF